ncbi:DNA-directed RNA polymerase specialized sigma subunit [Streptococcus infantarius subsp. infantarius]|nr:DNA-directed RNA polymerase specialized sigma subunit [Streptococcus infantarius subsp. infantarius]MCO4666215.1 DNA-directed RNA polymerase specialized sigma subunit [Streptococcus infantarius subsp. infantarius]MCO4689794.1 DNA-directed RNA polymerase specialized sigma subunit [Streptococcus infantarius subsp. infantarius]
MTNREKYQKRLDIRNNVRPFSDFTDNHFEHIIKDYRMNIEEIIEKKEQLQLLYDALLKLKEDEFKLINELFFQEKTLSEVSKSLEVSITTIARRRDKILNHLKKILI